MRTTKTWIPLALIAGFAAARPAPAQTRPTACDTPSGFAIAAGAAIVEEEWEVQVTDPDPDNQGPQVETYMSPVQDTSEPYLWFLLNARNAPGPFSAGGMEPQVWDYSDDLRSYSRYHSAQLSTANETITWRQRMYKPTSGSGSFVFQVCNGTSTTWGAFGGAFDDSGNWTYHPGPGFVYFSPNACSDFSQYNPAISVQMSRVTWEPNRIDHFRLLKVRQYDSGGKLLSTWTAGLDVDLTK